MSSSVERLNGWIAMIAWFSENGGTIAVLILLVAILVMAARKIINDRKSGKSGCGGCCCGCPMGGECHNQHRSG